MRLGRPFYRLPVRFDVARLREEVAALPAAGWVAHPNGIPGNSALRLITVDGAENDDVDGVMRPTPHLVRSPYLRQVLASFGVVWSRSRLMRLAGRAEVPEHADINYHWYYRVRVHIPVLTTPEVQFRCGGDAVHMAAGEAWVFDNWRRHSVVNPGDADRIHLVADTAGSSAFWQLVADGQSASAPRQHVFDPAHADVEPLLERTRLAPVMNPAEIDLLLLDLRAELSAEAATPDLAHRLGRYHAVLEAFRRDWRQMYALHGETAAGWPHYAALRRELRAASRELSAGLLMRTNRIEAHRVLEGRVLRALLPSVPSEETPGTATPTGSVSRPAAARPERPVFIIAAPRSGSTLLFETLASSRNLHTLGGEAPWLVEDLEALRPGAPGVESNRLTAEHATADHVRHVLETVASRLRDADQEPVPFRPELRLLEKTPKNALRIPFFERIFPDALYVFLWRDPRENLSSIMEAWRSGRWKTYNGLDGFQGPWSLLLPPGWRRLDGRPLADIAAFQWEAANRIVLDDLECLPRERWTVLRYSQLIADAPATIGRLCTFIGIEMDTQLRNRLSYPLPLSRFTQTPPDPIKWRRNEAEIERVLPSVTATWRRLEGLRPA
jgi:hypothetical protein